MKNLIRENKGSVIIIVLSILLLMSVIGSSMIKRGFFEFKRSKNLFYTNKVSATAYSAIEYAKADIVSKMSGDASGNFTGLLDGSFTGLNSASAQNRYVELKKGNLNNLEFTVSVCNNTAETDSGLYSKDIDGIVIVKGQVSNGKRVLYTLISYFKRSSDGITIKSTFRK